MKTTLHMVLFWGKSEIYSNFYYKPFVVNGIVYRCVEQFMMAMKARLFGDTKAEADIMKETEPYKMQQIGRTVQGYTDEAWFAARDEIVFQACLAKFQQNVHLGETLLATDEREMVEASPKDRIWGIGLGENDARALDKSKWLGENRLGRVLMHVRAYLREHGFTPVIPAQGELAL